MKTQLTILPLLLLGVTSCSTMQRVNDLVNESTYTINTNAAIVRKSTATILDNARKVDDNTKALRENKEHLQQGG